MFEQVLIGLGNMKAETLEHLVRVRHLISSWFLVERLWLLIFVTC